MIHQTEIKFVLSQGWGDFKNLWLMKYELQKAYNGYLKEGRIVWQEVKEGSLEDVEGNQLIPFLIVEWGFERSGGLQLLIDALTNTVPLQPTKQAEVDAELKATKYHLEDMRKLIFNKEMESEK